MRVLVATAAVAALAVATACDPYYAPPIRAVQYGAPARLREGKVEIGTTAGGWAVPNVLSPHVGVGIRDWIALEAGGNFNIDNYRYAWAMGFLGTRLSYAPHRERRVHFISDLELGLGVGRGGTFDANAPKSNGCTDCDGLPALDRTAGGGYGGFGIGARIGLLSLYGRARAEVSAATNIPTTVWPSMSVGAEFNIKERAAITLGGGYIGYVNSRDQEHGWFYQIGVVVFIDAFARHDAPAPAPTVTMPPRPPVIVPVPPPPPPDVEAPDEPMPDDESDEPDASDS